MTQSEVISVLRDLMTRALPRGLFFPLCLIVSFVAASSPAGATPMFQILGEDFDALDPDACGIDRVADVSNAGPVLVQAFGCTGDELETVYIPGQDPVDIRYGPPSFDGHVDLIAPDGSVVVARDHPNGPFSSQWRQLIDASGGIDYLWEPFDDVGQAAVDARGSKEPVPPELVDPFEVANRLGIGDQLAGLELNGAQRISPDGTIIAGTAPGEEYFDIHGRLRMKTQIWSISGIPVPEPSTGSLLLTAAVAGFLRRALGIGTRS